MLCFLRTYVDTYMCLGKTRVHVCLPVLGFFFYCCPCEAGRLTCGIRLARHDYSIAAMAAVYVPPDSRGCTYICMSKPKKENEQMRSTNESFTPPLYPKGGVVHKHRRGLSWLSFYLRAREVEAPAHVVHVGAVDVRHADVAQHEREHHVGHVPDR